MIDKEMDKTVNDFMEVIDNVVTKQTLDADYAWMIYNFVEQYKQGMFGEITLQEAINKCFEKWSKIYKEL
jgi:hypothetical protein